MREALAGEADTLNHCGGQVERSEVMTQLVLDTNVVLDWLVFRHSIGAPLEKALISGQCRWLCTRAMRDELARVVVRDSLARWAINATNVLAVFDALGVDMGPVPSLGAAERLPCSDPDDQMFIDLAIARRADALLTRDRAVLHLARRARRFGLLIATPEAWLQSTMGVCRGARRRHLGLLR